MINKFVEVYVDDMVDHLSHLTMAFEQMRKHKLKMNPLKCTFRVQPINFLGFLVH